MKNHIIFKFIAILLCAASLMGAVGSVAGVAVLTELDLYNKTVEQVRQDRVYDNVSEYSRTLALMHASSEMGGSPESMVTDVFDSGWWFQSQYPTYGYTISDAEGNILSSYNAHLKDTNASVYVTPATGQYMHLVSVEAQAEIANREAQAEMDAFTATLPESAPEIPHEGVNLTQVVFFDGDYAPVYEAECADEEYHVTYSYPDSSSGFVTHNSTDYTGFLFCNQYGQVVYSSSIHEDFESLPTTEIYHALFRSSITGFVYEMSATDAPIGTLVRDSAGTTIFISNIAMVAAAPAEAADEAPAPTEATEETIPETTAAETTPVETAAVTTDPTQETTAAETQETVAEAAAETTVSETVPETVPSSASALPDETGAADPTVSQETQAAVATEATEAVQVTEAVEASDATEATLPPETLPPETQPAEETVPPETEPILINGKTLDHYQVNTHQYYDSQAREEMVAKYVYLPMPELTVEMYVDESVMTDNPQYQLLALVREFRNYLLPAIGICLLVFAIFAVYLCTAAGRKPKTEEVRAGGLNRLPLDLYLCAGSFLIALCTVYGVEGSNLLLQRDFLVGCGTAVFAAFLVCLIFVAFCFAFVAQIKTPGGFWWRNTLCGHVIRLTAKFAVWLEYFLADKGFPFLGRSCKSLWQFTCKAAVWCWHSAKTILLWFEEKMRLVFAWSFRKLRRICHWTGSRISRFLSLLPLTWQWLVVGFLVIILLLIGIDAFKDGHNDWGFPAVLLLVFGVLLYVSSCFGTLAESTKRMSKGDLDTKVDDKLMVGCFKDFAADLNDLADVAVVAAQKQLKSERMKTELITNVSHDIKTPLTSIINYVDLLQKPHTEEEEAQYLEVLDRQSQRLKKLIDDLMDMSKANTGNMQVDITQVDAVESVNQALGEFADKLDKAHLIPVFRHDDPQVPMMADGKLVWRVLSNLLSNAVKYAMPGTRLYIDLMTLEGKVIISLKNISNEELNIDAEELMERFVRGDDSRNTEGSGLGLNIAKSLMELQKGQLQLLVDGDLFKVTLIFPGA